MANGAGLAADVNIGNSGAGAPTAAQTVDFAGSALNTTGTATVADGVTIGTVTASGGDRAGTLTFAGSGGAGAVGAITGNSIGVINAGVTGKTVTFSGEVGSYTINVTGTGTVEFQDKAAGFINFGGGNGTVKLGGDLHEGTVTTSTNNTGILEFTGNSTIGVDMSATSGDIGTSSAKLNQVKINGGNVVANGNIYATTINFATDHSLSIAAGKNLLAPVTTATNNTGTLTFSGSTSTGGAIGNASGNKLKAVNFNGGTVAIGHDIAADNILFNASSAATFTGNRALAGFVLIHDTASVDIGRTTLTVSGQNASGDHGFTLGAGATLKIELYHTGSANAIGKIDATADGAAVDASAKLDVNVTSTHAVADGQKFLLIDGNTTDHEVSAITTVTDNSAVLDFTTIACLHGTTTCAATGGDDLYLVASRVSGGYVAAASLPASSPAAAAANALDAIAQGGATGDMATVINALNSYDATTLAKEMKKTAPVASAATTSASFAVVAGGLNTVATRLAAVRNEAVQMADSGMLTGLAAGDTATSRHVWLKGFGARNKAGMRDGFDGYQANSGGLSLGADTEIAEGWTVGGAFTHAATAVDQQDARSGDSTRIKSYQLTGYAMKDFGAAYLDAVLSFARHDNTTQRATALNRTASGNFDGDQWSARLAGGYRMPLGGKTQLIPLASLEWSTLKQKAYTETGAGALNLSYQGTTTDSLKFGLGARLSGETAWGATTAMPEVHAIAFHDFGDARTDTTASFTGGGAAFTTAGQTIRRNSYNLGGSVALLTGRSSKVTVGYDFEGRSGFKGHSAQITGRWMF